MCDDVEALIAEMKKLNVDCSPIHNQGWGLLTLVNLPGGGKLGVYQPRHARPKSMPVRKAVKKRATVASKKSAKKTAAKKPAKLGTKKPAKKAAAKSTKKSRR
jgi:hypothetical protein